MFTSQLCRKRPAMSGVEAVGTGCCAVASLQVGINVNHLNAQGQTPLTVAQMNKQEADPGPRAMSWAARQLQVIRYVLVDLCKRLAQLFVPLNSIVSVGSARKLPGSSWHGRFYFE